MVEGVNLLTATASSLQHQLAAGAITSEQLVALYLDQIATFDSYLHAFISVTLSADLLSLARTLDAERSNNRTRSPLHGLPIVLKDNIATLPGGATCGSLALVGALPHANAPVVQKCLDAGMIVLGKTSLSEFCFRGDGMPLGWNAITGQAQSPYILSSSHGCYIAGEGVLADSSPGGSSTGSAIAVAAGFAPLALGTETEGSLVFPSSRAALYTLKPTPSSPGNRANLVGVVPLCPSMDTVGPMAKTPTDLAHLLDIILPNTTPSFTSNLTKPQTGWWSDLTIAAVDPITWSIPAPFNPSTPTIKAHLATTTHAAYTTIRPLAKSFTLSTSPPIPTPTLPSGPSALDALWEATFRPALNTHLATLATPSPSPTLASIIAYNTAHPATELPPAAPSQSFLHAAQSDPSTPADIAALQSLVSTAGAAALDVALHDADVLLGPAEGALTELAALADCPVVALPLGYADCAGGMGRPFGLAAVARPGGEGVLVRVMAAWEAAVAKGGRRVPGMGFAGG